MIGKVLLVVLLLALMPWGDQGETYVYYVPMASRTVPPVVPKGPGVAGCPTSRAQLDMLGAAWSFHWYWDAGGRPWCVPMLRSNASFDVDGAMRSCGGVCNAILFLNEPTQQEGCGLTCQVAFLHEYAPRVRAINPNVHIIFGNWPYPSRTGLRRFVAEWQALYPGEPLPRIDIGVHRYAWAYDYDPGIWRLGLLWYRQVARELLGAEVVVTEWGSLLDEALWYRVVSDQTAWLEAEGFPHALFLWGKDSAGLLCTMGTSGGELTECGQFYHDALEEASIAR